MCTVQIQQCWMERTQCQALSYSSHKLMIWVEQAIEYSRQTIHATEKKEMTKNIEPVVGYSLFFSPD